MEPKTWTLHKLAPLKNGEERWSIGKWGPRVYLTADRKTVEHIKEALELVELFAKRRQHDGNSILDDLSTAEVLLVRQSGEIGYGLAGSIRNFISKAKVLIKQTEEHDDQ